MENLRPRERKVLDLRFGLTGNGTHSLRQIGHLLRISKERVRRFRTEPWRNYGPPRSASVGNRAFCWDRAQTQAPDALR